MRNVDYAQEPFDLKLFALKCIRHFWVILLGIFLGSILLGVPYYYFHEVKAGPQKSLLTNKYYLTYAVDPSDLQTYSYFAGYTWTDFLKSDASMERIMKEMETQGFSSEDLSSKVKGSYEARLESDLRILYVTVTGEEASFITALSRALMKEMLMFPEEHREISNVELLTTGEIEPVLPDVRTLRAFVLGAVLGGFFATFGLGFCVMTGDAVDVPLTLQKRYNLPVLGYFDKKQNAHMGVQERASVVLKGSRNVAVTCVDPGLDLSALTGLLELQFEKEAEETHSPKAQLYSCDSILSNPKIMQELVDKEGVVVAVKAGAGNGKAVSQVYAELLTAGVKIKGFVLMEGDAFLINQYLFGRKIPEIEKLTVAFGQEEKGSRS